MTNKFKIELVCVVVLLLSVWGAACFWPKSFKVSFLKDVDQGKDAMLACVYQPNKSPPTLTCDYPESFMLLVGPDAGSIDKDVN